MTDRDQQGQPRPDAKIGPETLELRARPQPVTRINRKVVIGAAAILLCLISFIVLLALEPPSLRIAGSQELFNVEHKPVTDALSKLPASYDGVRTEKKANTGKQPPTPPPLLAPPLKDPLTDAERTEIARLARLAGQAKESAVFFRLQLKPAPKETTTADVRVDPVPKAVPVETDGGLATLSALRAADRVALATVLGVGSDLAFSSSDSDLLKALQQSTQGTTNRAGQRLIERQLNVQPTIKVRPGWPLRVIVRGFRPKWPCQCFGQVNRGYAKRSWPTSWSSRSMSADRAAAVTPRDGELRFSRHAVRLRDLTSYPCRRCSRRSGTDGSPRPGRSAAAAGPPSASGCTAT
jgi:hypothetical protein